MHPTQNMTRQKYKPSLTEYMSLCATNYAKMLPLIRSKDDEKKLHRYALGENGELIFKQIERASYTETYEVSLIQEVESLENQICRVRLYHDAKVAEVIANSHPLMLAPNHVYPNKKMKMPNEKIQLNRFLGEWLNFCLQFGQSHSLNKNYLAFL